MFEELGLLAFTPAKLFLIGVDWSTSELLVKRQLCEETMTSVSSLIHPSCRNSLSFKFHTDIQ
jgi:hypothetical protein